jgi:peptidyl-tRNA hydrolase, PTH1 family
MTDSPIVIIGLGNPGREYEQTRHNAGFLACDVVSKQVRDLDWSSKKDLQSDVAKFDLNGQKFLLVKPQTFMNNSGQAVQAVIHYYKVVPESIWVIHDELDMPLGKAQIRRGGGMSGHHGLESIAQHIGTTDFGRIRIGIRGQALREYHAQVGIDTNNFVMGRFEPREIPILNQVFELVIPQLLRLPHVESQTITVPGFEALPSA